MPFLSLVFVRFQLVFLPSPPLRLMLFAKAHNMWRLEFAWRRTVKTLKVSLNCGSSLLSMSSWNVTTLLLRLVRLGHFILIFFRQKEKSISSYSLLGHFNFEGSCKGLIKLKIYMKIESATLPKESSQGRKLACRWRLTKQA